MKFSPAGTRARWRFRPTENIWSCANAGSDTLSVIDTRTDKIVETICARQNPGDLFGAQPNALAFDKSRQKTFLFATAPKTPWRFSNSNRANRTCWA